MQLDMDLCSQHLKTVTQLLRENPAERNLRDAGGMISYVKEANSRACSLLKTALAEAYPDISWGYSERTGASFSNGSGSGASWIYDPIDGAYHYLMGLPLWSSSLALVGNGETRAAFVYDPVLDEMFTAVKGEQASLNGREIRSSDRKLLEAAVVATTMPSFKFDGRDATDATIASIQKVVPAVFSLRIMASSSLQLAYVAAGRLDAYWSMDGDVEDWLAGALLAEEAGALVTNAESGNFTIGDKSIVASGQNLSTQIAHLLKKETEPDNGG